LAEGSKSPNHPLPASETENQFHRYTTIDVNEITVSVTSSVLLAQQQRQLFDQNPRLDRPALAHLINRLANRLGTQNVVYPSLQSGAQPEYSFRLLPLVDPGRKRRRRKTQPPKQSQTLARPFRLFHPPLRLNQGHRNKGARPLCFHSTENPPRPLTPTVSNDTPPPLLQVETGSGLGQPQKIIASWGPERIETGWWRGRTVCRDYWRIETETQQQLWIFRDLRSGEWFLHGEF
jgi:protein ImuB